MLHFYFPMAINREKKCCVENNGVNNLLAGANWTMLIS